MSVRIALVSDTHLEFGANQRVFEENNFFAPDPASYDVLVLAGDIDYGFRGIDKFRAVIPVNKPLIYLFGNHEHYRRNLTDLVNASKSYDKYPNTHILAPGTTTLDGINFIGATLWSSGLLNGYPDSRAQIQLGINDFRLIMCGVVDPFTVHFMNRLYEMDRDYINHELNTLNGTKVVITHFLPSQECMDPKYVGSALSPYFVNDCDDLVTKADLWLMGHDHQRFDKSHSSGTRMVDNCFGYGTENPGPYEWKIIEV
jgi:predicted phosphodiesterase